MPAPALQERQEPRADDAHKRRRKGVVRSEAQLEHDRSDPRGLHVLRERERRVKAVQLHDPLKEVGDGLKVHVPAQFVERGAGLEVLEALQLAPEGPGGGVGCEGRRFEARQREQVERARNKVGECAAVDAGGCGRVAGVATETC